MKGMELPISTMVIIVIAVIVLVAMIALLSGVWPSTPQTMTLETAKDNACSLMASTGCSLSPSSIAINNFDANKDEILNGGVEGLYPPSCFPVAGNDNLARLCLCYYSADETNCKENICGCLGPSP